MFVAADAASDHIYTGTEIQLKVSERDCSIVERNLSCPICGEDVKYTSATVDRPFDYFAHTDGCSDCFDTDSMSGEHRLGVEITVKALYNRVREVSRGPVEIDVERWIGRRPNFVITDVRITEPLQIAAEMFYRSGDLELRRRLDTMFENGYRTYLVFHSDGLYDADQVESHLQQITPLRVGRFDRESLDLTLGDLFTENQINLGSLMEDNLPKYLR
jgi:hypothetical protein